MCVFESSVADPGLGGGRTIDLRSIFKLGLFFWRSVRCYSDIFTTRDAKTCVGRSSGQSLSPKAVTNRV